MCCGDTHRRQLEDDFVADASLASREIVFDHANFREDVLPRHPWHMKGGFVVWVGEALIFLVRELWR